MRVFSVDPGTIKCGWSVVEKGFRRPVLVASGVLKPKGKMIDRVGILGREVSALLKKYQPDGVALEAGFVNQGRASAVKVEAVRGAVIGLAGDLGLGAAEYAPSTVKLSVAGHGGASKAQVQGAVKKLFKLKDVPPEDEADAIAVGVHHLGVVG